MDLPVVYKDLAPIERRNVRNSYVMRQNGLCWHCKNLLSNSPPAKITSLHIDRSLFPKGFFDHKVHLHHSHKTGMTIGAVHALCNAVLWQYHGE